MSRPPEDQPLWLTAPQPASRSQAWPRDWRRFWLTLPVVVVLSVAGLALLGLYGWAAWARADFTDGDYSAAEGAYRAQHSLTQRFPEPWKGSFNEGTAVLGGALAGSGAFADARVLLEEALSEVPEAAAEENGGKPMESAECKVRLNLSLAIEGQALAAAADDDKAGAVAFYDEAMDVIGPCSSDGESEKDSSSEEQEQPQNDADSTEQRQLQGKEQQEESQQQDQDQSEQPDQQDGESEDQDSGGTSDEQEGESGEASPTPDPNQMNEDDPRVQELQERNEEAQREAEEYQQGTGGGFGGGQNW